MRKNFLLFICSLLLVACQKPGDVPLPKEKDSSAVASNKPYEFDIPVYFPEYEARIPSDNPTTTAGVELGRMLFYEKKLSGDNSMACATCHQQSKAFTDGKAVSVGIDGIVGTKSAMSIENMLWSNRFFWDGRAASLEEQAKEPIPNPIEMHQSLDKSVEKIAADTLYPEKFKTAFGTAEVTSDRIAKAIAQFERTLISKDSKYDQYLRGEYQPTNQEMEGMNLFLTHPIAGQTRGGNCGDCHSGVLTSGLPDGFVAFHNNGLDSLEDMDPGLYTITKDSADFGKFKAPSLRNIALTAPYMHDGRFNTLEEVLDHYNDHIHMSKTLDGFIIDGVNEPIPEGQPIKLGLTDDEKAAIIAFLKMLTDEKFVTNPDYSSPFKK